MGIIHPLIQFSSNEVGSFVTDELASIPKFILLLKYKAKRGFTFFYFGRSTRVKEAIVKSRSMITFFEKRIILFVLALFASSIIVFLGFGNWFLFVAGLACVGALIFIGIKLIDRADKAKEAKLRDSDLGVDS